MPNLAQMSHTVGDNGKATLLDLSNKKVSLMLLGINSRPFSWSLQFNPNGQAAVVADEVRQ